MNTLNTEPTLQTQMFGHAFPSPLILGSGTLVEKYHEIQPYIDAGAGAIVPRSTRKVMERKVHPSPHLYESGKRGHEMMLNAEWTGADIDYWREFLAPMQQSGRVIMSVSGRDVNGCVDVCREIDQHRFSMIEVNISCAHSNSVHGMITRNSEHIRAVVGSLKDAGIVTPVVLKLGHSDFIVELSQVAKEAGADGIVAVNTFGPLLDFDVSTGQPKPVLGIAGARGGMSGAPLFNIALTDVAMISKEVGLPVIGCGGVRTAEDAIKMVMAGALGVQVYSAAHVLGIHGPKVFTTINNGILKYLKEHNLQSLDQIRGSALRLLEQPTNLKPIVPELVAEDCTGCDKCIDVCLPGAISPIEWDNKAKHVIAISTSQCVGCGHCVHECPTDALRIFDRL